MTARTENGGRPGAGRWRMASWLAAALFLAAMFISSRFSTEVQWTVSDFFFAGVLLFGSLGAYEIAARTTRSAPYRAAIGIAIAAALLLIWINAAVGITDSAADAMYLGVVAVGLVGALIARFRPLGMAAAMFAAAAAQTLIGVIALLSGIVPAYNSAFEILGITTFFAALFVGSALLFRQAATAPPEGGAA
ncbi:MAG: hypothetical protein ACOCTG_01805 [Bacteroidota bacterium]